VLEDVIFESWPGWEVNASVYLPLASQYPPPWTPIIMPVGHGPKTGDHTQIPAQVFARCGYLVITFDPPGFGEKAAGNDHFVDGVRCYLTGTTSQRFFLLDALRSIDYAASRPDVDMSHGVGMTGVSGGGVTTLYCTLLDRRIKAAAPSCFTSPEAYNPLRNAYACCPETMAIGRYRQGIDTIDLLTAAFPTPLLLMAGKLDTLFRAEWSQQVADEVSHYYGAGNGPDRFDFYLDESPHSYTYRQALRAVAWMDRWVRGIPARQLPQLTREDLELVPDDMLQCHPHSKQNMFSINSREAEHLAALRRGLSIRASAMKLAGLEEKTLISLQAREVEASTPFPELDGVTLQESLLGTDEQMQIPATLLGAAKPSTPTPAVLYFDDRGRWHDLVSGGALGEMSGLTQGKAAKVAVLSVDLPGWGDSSPAAAPYEVYGWGSPHRWISYISAATANPAMAMRIRAGLACLTYLRSRPGVDPARIVVGGHGEGAVVAMHVAAIDAHVRGVFANEILGSFQSLTDSATYAWEPEIFFPGVLKFYDLPEMAADLSVPLLVINPLDAMKAPLSDAPAQRLYAAALTRGHTELKSGLDASAAQAAQIAWVNHLCGR